jgi:Uma2 family endonuclease
LPLNQQTVDSCSTRTEIVSTNLHLSATEYDRMVERGAFDHLNRKIELIYGEIREMNPAGPIHDDLIAYLNDWSVHATDRERIRVTVQSGLDLANLNSRPEPDLLWVRAARYRDRHPTAADVKLAIEVSDSSLQADLIEKAALYAQAGIVEYWIVDAKGQCVHVFRDPKAGEYTQRNVAKIGEFLSPLESCKDPLDLNDLFV